MDEILKNPSAPTERAFDGKGTGILLSPTEAEEYCKFKREKYIRSVVQAMEKASLCGEKAISQEDERRLFDLAIRHGAASFQTTPCGLPQAKRTLVGRKTAIDCIVGGNGKTLSKVKAYEARLAYRGGAKEITLVLNPDHLQTEKWSEMKKEIKRVSRKARKGIVRVWLDKRENVATFFRFARFFAEAGVGVSVPYFEGVERLKTTERIKTSVEVRDVETATQYERLAKAGIDRIQTSRLQEIYDELMKEAEDRSFAVPVMASPSEAQTVFLKPPATEETDETVEEVINEEAETLEATTEKPLLEEEKTYGEMIENFTKG